MASTIALQYISRLRLTETPPMVDRVLNYLQRTFDEQNQLWIPVPESIDQFPRAVWWEYQDLEKAEQYWANPNAEIVGYLYEFPGIVSDEVRRIMTTKAFAKLENRMDPLEMHDLLCYLRMAERLPQDLRSRLFTLLDPHVHMVVSTKPEQWVKYGLQPIQVAPSPESHYYPALRTFVDENLNFLITHQGDDGAWNPTWEWGRYEKVWQRAKEEWKGVLTLDNLRILRAFHRLET
jgi:hypothetical protein